MLIGAPPSGLKLQLISYQSLKHATVHEAGIKTVRTVVEVTIKVTGMQVII